ncbi:uncharacterized protein TRUGW13939_01033 [Talaromyces rugulosus]|uniref:Sulfatase N-terminal domain-containing protein n=1 Tax=Talaromyces rugulosus TaxID=121627 RepID=A0A7H8QL58_TALRU|nr:uncharacterized protein TRUGW13939_01033 [Talaromyces rugulosus]QKX53953.1 hypothetical protein TRUGW13939_01033 [Talaromyces rugulosus]
MFDLRRLIVVVANRRFVFALAAIAILAAKLIHISSHISALTTREVKKWGFSFFTQDVLLLVIIRFLLDSALFPPRGPRFVRLGASTIAYSFIAFTTTLSIINICFFVVSGSEIHWRNVGVAGGAAGRALVLSGLLSSIVVMGILTLLSWAFQNILFVVVGLATDAITCFVAFVTRGRLCDVQLQSANDDYLRLPQSDMESAAKPKKRARPSWTHFVLYIVVISAILIQIIQSFIRPHDRSLTFMSWTPALLPFIDLKNSAPNLETVIPHYKTGINHEWDSLTPLRQPIPLPWLPEEPIDGFEDWYKNELHYDASADPLRISNLEEPLRPELGDLKDVPIRHIMTIVLESTRKDVFPIRESGASVERLKNSWDDKKLPDAALKRLKSLTPVAKFLTGDYDDDFERPAGEEQKKRGGMSFNDAYTTSTFTLKSLTGALCGIMPMVADFNLEYLHHVYQPCLPHIWGALNTLEHEDDGSHDFEGYKWASTFMQSVTLDWDHFGSLMEKLGFSSDGGLIDKEYLIKDTAKFGKVDLKNINYFGFEETPLEDYIRDEFEKAKKDDGRVFITHVTSTTHHPFGMPANETYVPLGKGLDDLSHYINAVGYDDRWLGRILDTIDDLGVANETLLVFMGDHGLSIPENDILPTYYNPHIINNHVPLVFSHPKLPAITIDDAVSTQQILPTILDLLIETGSVSGAAANATRDLLHNYEGQSLLRRTRNVYSGPETNDKEVSNWQFTNINPGRAMLGLRDARQKTWRMVVPVVDNQEWQFFDTARPDVEAVVAFEFSEYQKKIEESYGEDEARWVEEAAFVARWALDENSRRWRYGPYEP